MAFQGYEFHNGIVYGVSGHINCYLYELLGLGSNTNNPKRWSPSSFIALTNPKPLNPQTPNR